MAEKKDPARWAQGLEMMNKVYGPGSSGDVQGLEDKPFIANIVNNVFAEIWASPALSIAQKRLLVIGATAALGRADLIEVQVGGAIANGELSDEQLDEILPLMMIYAGVGNTTATMRGIEAAKAKAKKK